MALTISPMDASFGVTVSGIDFTGGICAEDQRVLHDLWLEHGILLLRGVNASAEQQIEFSRLFGALESHPLKTIRSGAHPELIELSSEDARNSPRQRWDGEEVIGRLPWHKDLIYTARPNRGAVLRAVVLPERDGETGFGDQALAYDALPETTKTRIHGLEVVYRFEVNLFKMPFLDTSGYDPGPNGPKSPADLDFPDFPDSLYPLVLVHPVTGRKSLNVCPMFMDHLHGVDAKMGDTLLQELVAHVCRPEFTYLHTWVAGDMILWDNWRMMHSARGIRPGERRLIHRTTITGYSGDAGERALGRALNSHSAAPN